MIAIFNKFRIGLLPIYVLLAILTASVSLVSCSKDDELEIQNDFPFEVNVMPVPKDVANGQTVEIRITIQRTGNYSNTQYFLRYFQFDGQEHCNTTMNRRISPMTCINYQRSSSGCITLQHLPYHSPLMFGFRTVSGMKSR